MTFSGVPVLGSYCYFLPRCLPLLRRGGGPGLGAGKDGPSLTLKGFTSPALPVTSGMACPVEVEFRTIMLNGAMQTLSFLYFKRMFCSVRKCIPIKYIGHNISDDIVLILYDVEIYLGSSFIF